MENMTFLQRLVNLVFTPSKAFDGLGGGVDFKTWFYPFIIVSIAMIVLPSLYVDISYMEAEKRFEKTERQILDNPNLTEEQLAQVQERIDKARDNIADAKANPWAIRNTWGYLLRPLFLAIHAAVFAGILLLVGNFGLGGKTSFANMFTMVMLTYLIGGNGTFINMYPGIGFLEMAVKTPLIIARGATDITLSPGLLFDQVDSFIKQFINQLDVFRVWGMILMGFGFAKLYDKPTATGITMVGIPWLILVSISAALIQSIPS